MTGTIALEGGAEFSPRCRDLDLAVLATAPFGPIVILAGASSVGEDYARSSANGVAAHRRLVDDEVRAAPDPREDLAGAIGALRDAAMVVMPGGSPAGLLQVVLLPGIAEVLRGRWEDGATIVGSSAGAMVLGSRTWLPDEDRVTDGLGFVPGIVRPHHTGDTLQVWVGEESTLRWGLPECGGVLVDDNGVRSVGVAGALVARGADAVLVPTKATPLADLLD